MNKKAFALFWFLVIAFSFLINQNLAKCQSNRDNMDNTYYKEKGMHYFNEGFYKLTPRGKNNEARKQYQLAINAFKEALKIKEDKDTRSKLARVYYVQQDYEMAAGEYMKASQLDPYDIDTYVNLALTYMDLKKFNKAIETLEAAKTWTADENIIMKLNSYIETAEKVKNGKEGTGDDD